MRTATKETKERPRRRYLDEEGRTRARYASEPLSVTLAAPACPMWAAIAGETGQASAELHRVVAIRTTVLRVHWLGRVQANETATELLVIDPDAPGQLADVRALAEGRPFEVLADPSPGDLAAARDRVRALAAPAAAMWAAEGEAPRN